MRRPCLAAFPLATALACTFDATALLSAGPPAATDPGSTGPEPTTAPPATTTSSGTTGLTLDPATTGLPATTAVDPDTTGTPGPSCGDGVLDDGELCDGDQLGDETCAGLGFSLGALACTAACQFDTSGCKEAPADWYDPAYLKRRTLTITKDKIQGALTEFPVVVGITDPAVVAALGPADRLAFASVNKVALAHEIALADDARLFAWVKIDALDAANDEIFYLYYGDPDAPDSADPAGTWSNGFFAVWHLDEKVPDDMNTGIHLDSTGHGHSGAQSGNHGLTMDCLIGDCQLFEAGEWINVAKHDAFDLGNTDATISAWIRTATKKDCGVFAKSSPNAAQDAHLILGVRGNGKPTVEQLGAGSLDSNDDVLDGGWHNIVWTQKKDVNIGLERWILYVDGVQRSDGTPAGKSTSDAHPVRLAGPTSGSNFSGNFEGRLDEVQVSLAVRTSEWIATAHANQRSPTTFVTVGPEEAL